MPRNETHIGDGVYCSFDGYQIWLRTERENGWHEIALDPYTWDALNRFQKKLAETPIQEESREYASEPHR